MYKSENVALTQLEQNDSEVLFRWINNKDLVHFNNSYRPIVWENHKKWFSQVTCRDDLVIFAIRNTKNELIGTCQLHSIDNLNQNAELQIRIGNTASQSKGLGKEALKLLLEFGWNELNLNKIYLYVFDDNERAKAAYKKVGFETEGLLKQHFYINGHFKDVRMMSVFKKAL